MEAWLQIGSDYTTVALTGLCQYHRISSLSVSGFILRDDFSPGNDTDVLVKFQPGVQVDFFAVSRM